MYILLFFLWCLQGLCWFPCFCFWHCYDCESPSGSCFNCVSKLLICCLFNFYFNPLNHGLFRSVTQFPGIYRLSCVLSLYLSLSLWYLGVSILYFLWFLLFYFLRFVAQDMVYLGVCSVSPWNTCVFCCWVGYSVNVDGISLAPGGVEFFCILAGFLINCSVVDRRMLRFPALLVDSCISIFSPVRVWFMCSQLCCLAQTHLGSLCLSDGLILYVMAFSLLAFFALKSALSAVNIAILACFRLVFAWHIFPSFFFEPVCIVTFEVSFLQAQ